MTNVNWMKKGTISLSLLAMLAGGALLYAAEGGILNKQDLKALIGNAKTAADHQRIAKHFDAKADELEAESKEHHELAAKYKANPTGQEMKHPMSGQTAGHCQFFADDLHKAAVRARQMATDHREMAKASK